MKINNIKKYIIKFIKKWIFWIYILVVIVEFIYFYFIKINLMNVINISINSIIFLSIIYYIRKFIYIYLKCKKFIENLYIKYPIIFVIRYNLFNIPRLVYFFWRYIWIIYRKNNKLLY